MKFLWNYDAVKWIQYQIVKTIHLRVIISVRVAGTTCRQTRAVGTTALVSGPRSALTVLTEQYVGFMP